MTSFLAPCSRVFFNGDDFEALGGGNNLEVTDGGAVQKKEGASQIERKTLTESLSNALEIYINNKVDQADWYEIGSLSADKVLRMLERIKSQKGVSNGGLSDKTVKWIEDGLNVFKPAQDETFAEYLERRFMKSDQLRLPALYNDIIRVVKIFNQTNGKVGVDRQMIGEMPVKKVFEILNGNENARENIGIKSVLDHSVQPNPKESLRRYFYRLTAHNRGFLNDDGTVDEKAMQDSDDFKEMVVLLQDIIPRLNNKKDV